MQARAFNEISINLSEGYLTKTSTQLLKIKDEINYYLNLPSKISRFFPKLIEYKKDYSSYKMEYIPYLTLSELLVDNQLSIKEGEVFLKKIFAILDKIHAIKPIDNQISHENLLNFYIGKTLTRIDNLKTNKEFGYLINQPFIIINGCKYKTFKLLKTDFINSIKEYISQCSSITAIHGDFCFSNILYCPKRNDIKLIDPRGSFGNKGIYGDPYYDYAKILHCVHGQYDYMVHHQYQFKQNKDKNFEFKKPYSSLLSALHKSCRAILEERQVNLKFI